MKSKNVRLTEGGGSLGRERPASGLLRVIDGQFGDASAAPVRAQPHLGAHAEAVLVGVENGCADAHVAAGVLCSLRVPIAQQQRLHSQPRSL
jgi:hypothetical protein